MRNEKNSRRSIVCLSAQAAGLACGLGLVMPQVTVAAPWEYGVIVDLGVAYTDNVFLSNDGLEESETVYTIAPELFLTTDGERLVANLRYRPEAFFYSKFSDADDVFQVLDASLTGALVRDRFFVYLSAVSFQSIITPVGTFPTSNLPISGNRTDSRTYEVRPYWQQRLGQANLLLEAGYRAAEFDSDLSQSNDERYGRFKLDNIERQQGLAWGLEYEYRRIEYDLSIPFEFQRAALDLGLWVNGSMRIFAVAGAETAFDNTFESNLDEGFWEAGFQYKPNQRLNLEFAAGERSFGTSLRGNFSYTLRRGEIALTYNEGPVTRGQLAFDRRPITNTDNLDNILDRPGRSDRFVQRRGELNTNIELSRSELTLRIFAEQRESRTTAGGIPLDDEEFWGAAIRWSWNVGTRTTLGIGADFSERDQAGRRDEIRRGQVDLTYKLTQRLSVRLEGMHSKQDGNESGAFDYTENQVRFLLRMEF